jgi:hypothetical protein
MQPDGHAQDQARDRVPVRSDDPRGLVSRTNGLFQLLVSACDGSRREASRLIDIDLRTFDTLRAVPNLEFVARIGLGLGLDARSAAAVIGASETNRVDPAEIRSMIIAADLADDPIALDWIAERLSAGARNPGDLRLAQVVRARALVARGDADGAVAALLASRAIAHADEDSELLVALERAARFEAVLAEPTLPMQTVLGFADERVEPQPASEEQFRRRCWSLAHRMIGSDEPVAEVVAAMHAAIECADSPRKLAWSASIAALAALRARHLCARVPADDNRLVALIVACELRLEETVGQTDAIDRALLIRRLARVIWREWQTRVLLGEFDPTVVDALDADELVRAKLCLRNASTAPELTDIVKDFTRIAIEDCDGLPLDASSSGCWMDGHVHNLRVMVAPAGGRSEDPC